MGTDFENYYREFPHHEFATMVWVNNAWVAAQCIVFGVLGLPVLWVSSRTPSTHHRGADGQPRPGISLLRHDPAARAARATAVFVAGGAGLWLFWSWIEPGPRPRAVAFAEAGRTVVGIALGSPRCCSSVA